MINDLDTNFVYFFKMLRDWQISIFKCLITLLDDMGIQWGLLEHTNDYWVRDFYR